MHSLRGLLHVRSEISADIVQVLRLSLDGDNKVPYFVQSLVEITGQFANLIILAGFVPACKIAFAH